MTESVANVSTVGAVIADETQDLGQQEIRLLAALTAGDPGGLMLVGDAGQRIYPGGYSLKALGVNVTGRSKRLRVSYRTSERIRRFASRLLGDRRDDLDGAAETTADTVSLIQGNPPVLRRFTSAREQAEFIARTVASLRERGIEEHEVGIFVRTNQLVDQMVELLSAVGVCAAKLGESGSGVNVGTMYKAKGLEFKAVFVPYCQHGKVPNYAALKDADPGDLETVKALERQLLYVSLTRARDELFVTWIGKPSEFLLPLLSVEGAATSRPMRVFAP